MTEELYKELFGSILSEGSWVEYDEAKTIDNEIEIVVQINGKLKSRLNVAADVSAADAIAAAKADEKIATEIAGKTIGEDFDVNVTFPEDYNAENLAGKPAVFKCKIHEIKREILPEIDDELASDVSDFETLAEYKEDLKKKLQEKAAETDLSVMKDRVLEQLYKLNEIEVPAVKTVSFSSALINAAITFLAFSISTSTT